MGDKVRQFEDLDAWNEAKAAVVAVYRLTSHTSIARDFALKDQVQRAAVSMMSNIAEGFERLSKAEKRHLYSVARASAGEARSLLYVIAEVYPETEDQARTLQGQIVRTGKLITGLIRSTESRQ